MATIPPRWPVFLAYRQTDGKWTAQWLHSCLDGAPAVTTNQSHDPESAPQLSVYFDQDTPAVANWKSVHAVALKKARAFVLVCSPGAAVIRDEEHDFLSREISWWMKNRDTAPIIIDTTGDGERWIPDPVRRRWPDAQRISVIPEEIQDFSSEEELQYRSTVRRRIIAGIIASQSRVTDQDLERERRLSRLLKAGLIVFAMLFVFAAAAAGFSAWLWKSRDGVIHDLEETSEIAAFEHYCASLPIAERLIDEAQFLSAREVLENVTADKRHWEWGHLYSLALWDRPLKETTYCAEAGYRDLVNIRRMVRKWTWTRTNGAWQPDSLVWGSAQHLADGTAVSSVTDPTNRYMVSGFNSPGRSNRKYSLIIEDLESRSVVSRIDGYGSVQDLEFDPSGSFVLVAIGSAVDVYSSSTGEWLASLDGHSGVVTGVAFSPDGRRIATVSPGHAIRLWDWPTARPVYDLPLKSVWRNNENVDLGDSDIPRDPNIEAAQYVPSWDAKPGFSPDGLSIVVNAGERALIWSSLPRGGTATGQGEYPERSIRNNDDLSALADSIDSDHLTVLVRRRNENEVQSTNVDTVTVQDSEAFIRAINTDTAIILKPGTYNLEEAAHVDNSNLWSDEDDLEYYGLVRGVRNLTIAGEGDGDVILTTTQDRPFLLSFSNCSDLRLSNLIFQSPVTCIVDVSLLGMRDCSGIEVSSCVLNGNDCSAGVRLWNVADTDFEDVVIKGCPENVLSLYLCEAVLFSGAIEDNSGSFGIEIDLTRDVLFQNTVVRGNALEYLFDVWRVANIRYRGGALFDNKFEISFLDSTDIRFENVSINQ